MANTTEIPAEVCEYWLSYQIRQDQPDRFKFRFRLDENTVWSCDSIISDPTSPPVTIGTDNSTGRIRLRARIVPDGKTFWLFGE